MPNEAQLAGRISLAYLFRILETTSWHHAQRSNLPNRLQLPAVLFPALLLAAIVFVAVDTDWNELADRPDLKERVELVQADTLGGVPEDERLRLGEAAERSGLGDLLTNDYVLAFEVASVLLLAAAIGALALVRERRT